jgi:hypothetical protein
MSRTSTARASSSTAQGAGGASPERQPLGQAPAQGECWVVRPERQPLGQAPAQSTAIQLSLRALIVPIASTYVKASFPRWCRGEGGRASNGTARAD